MSTQLIGFSIGGICKRFLVSPPSMSAFHPVPSFPLFSDFCFCSLPHSILAPSHLMFRSIPV